MAIEEGELEHGGTERRLEILRNSHNAMRVFLAIIMAVALKEALATVFIHGTEGVKHLSAFEVQEVVLFAVFLVVLGRFFIGDLRHLDATFVESAIGASGVTTPARPLHRFVDLHLLIVRGVILFYLALSIHAFGQFHLLYLALLGLDVVWVGVIYLLDVGRRGEGRALGTPEVKWGLNSTAFLVLLGALYVAVPSDASPGLVLLAFAALVVANSLFDYRLAWDYYFPTLRE